MAQRPFQLDMGRFLLQSRGQKNIHPQENTGNGLDDQFCKRDFHLGYDSDCYCRHNPHRKSQVVVNEIPPYKGGIGIYKVVEAVITLCILTANRPLFWFRKIRYQRYRQ